MDAISKGVGGGEEKPETVGPSIGENAGILVAAVAGGVLEDKTSAGEAVVLDRVVGELAAIDAILYLRFIFMQKNNRERIQHSNLLSYLK